MDILDADGTIFLLITNGYILTEEKIKKLKKYHFQWIQISIDGASSKSHDELRQKEGSWEKAVNAALMVADAGLPLTIAHSIIPNEIDELPKMAGLAYQCGASLFIVGEIFSSGRAAMNTELLLNMEQRSRLWNIVENLSLLYNGRMVVARSTSNKTQLNEAMELPNTGVIVRPNGDIRLECTAPFVIGNVLTSSFFDQWSNGKHKWKHEKVAEFIDSVDQYSGISALHTNYIGEDIYL
jgi:MoaA/NifB/PqqE/SkfB family radical SAM enzyme